MALEAGLFKFYTSITAFTARQQKTGSYHILTLSTATNEAKGFNLLHELGADFSTRGCKKPRRKEGHTAWANTKKRKHERFYVKY